MTVVFDADPELVAVSLIVIPARLSVVFSPVPAVTLPAIEADAACEAVPDFCAAAGTVQIINAISNAPRSEYERPSLPVRRNFNGTLSHRTETL